MTIRHGHSSSRYDKPPKTLAEQVGRATTSGKDGNLLTFTEVDTKDRAAKLSAVTGTTLIQSGESSTTNWWSCPLRGERLWCSWARKMR